MNQTDTVDHAAQAVDEALYRGEDGQAVRQTTAAPVVHRHLRLLDIGPGDSILEIGTGSGYSAAIIAELVGPTGYVTSIDLEPGLAERAAVLHRRAGRGNITSITADGAHGYPDHGPYDHLVAWTTPPAIPDAWINQIRPGGTLLAPVKLADITYATAMLRATVTADGALEKMSLHRGAYVIMDAPGRESFEADTADAQHQRPGDEHTSYVSAEWLRGRPDDARHVLDVLLNANHTEPGPADWPDTEHLKTWLIARNPPGLVATGIDHEIGIGIANGDHIAIIKVLPIPGILADSPDSPALVRLQTLTKDWQNADRRRIEELVPAAVRKSDGWHIHAVSPGS